MDDENPRAIAPRFLARDPSMFHAQPHEDAAEWLERVDQVADFNQWTQDQRLQCVGMFLEWVARRWYASRQQPVTLNLFRQEFLQAIRPPHHSLMIKNQLRKRVKGSGESAVHHCFEILSLCEIGSSDGEWVENSAHAKGIDTLHDAAGFSILTPQSPANKVLARVQLECQSDMLVKASNWTPSPISLISNGTRHFD